MPIVNVYSLNIITTDWNYKEIYWPKLSEEIRGKYGFQEEINPPKIEKVLKDCYSIFSTYFDELIKTIDKVSFFVFANNFHENTIDLWKKQLSGESILPLEEIDFAADRRGIKLILEQAPKIGPLKSSEEIPQELLDSKTEYVELIEELLYLSRWIYGFSEHIAQIQLVPKSITLKFKGELLSIIYMAPYNDILKAVRMDMNNHFRDAVIDTSALEFIKILEEEFQLNYQKSVEIIAAQLNNPRYRMGVIHLDNWIKELCVSNNWDEKNTREFLSGFMLGSHNVQVTSNSVFKPQNLNRFLYRPILLISTKFKKHFEFSWKKKVKSATLLWIVSKLEIVISRIWDRFSTTSDQDFGLVGPNKMAESLTAVMSNSLPWGHAPEEWLRRKAIRKFVDKLRLEHDKVLEKPIVEILQKKSLPFDVNIKSIYTGKAGQNVSIESISGVGEIDILFAFPTLKTLFVCECKHNRSRFDLNSWRREYSNFKNSYENQLEGKIRWVETHKGEITEHLKESSKDNGLDFTGYQIEGIFIINSPSFYKYNSPFKVLTIYDFQNFIDNKYNELVFKVKDENGSIHQVSNPIFDNLSSIY